ncbi:ABC transporter substrate-binding protein [uncultured Ferrovibrio sp.]|jgi:branched-chain amino acid transport system substrate-binding protein|uniref:ABC transporter substrate-binding protein n=1 Tax=uncultured Ferrovibrio sp. TaxID=1576913 RepID=UPI002632F7F7|nr:ABC transporter substrate-binding protein [uncultured Ferrovibrio sp.]
MRRVNVLAVAAAASSVLFVGHVAAQPAKVRGVTKTEIVIGMHTDLSGPAASYGVNSSNAMRMRIEEVNAQGGIHGRKIKLVVEDNQYQVPRAVQAANKLLHRDNIFLMAGSLGTPMNNAVLPDQFKAGVPNLFPLTAARQMYQPFDRMKFVAQSSYYDQIRAGIAWMVASKGKKRICSLYQDTDFGKEIFEAARDQAKAMNMELVETATNKPADTDFTAQISKLRAANCDLIASGSIIRDAIVPYGTARKMGWNDVDFIGSSASYDQTVAGAPGGATEGFYAMAGTVFPYRDTAPQHLVAWMDRYKETFGSDPNIGAVYGYSLMDLIITALDRAGKDLTTDAFIKGMESIKGYRDMFGGPVVSFGPDKHQGSNESFLYQVQKGKFVTVAGPVNYGS